MDRSNAAINRILEEAADLVGREKEAAGNVESTEGYKGRQIERLKEFGMPEKALNFILGENAKKLFEF